MILIEDCFKELEEIISGKIEEQKVRQEKANKLFIEAFGLGDLLDPTPSEKDIGIRRPDLRTEITHLLSYSVGCILGRYSPDFDGLAFAGGEWKEDRYKTFQPVKNNLVIVGARNKGLPDDLSSRVSDFIKAVFGESTHSENMKFIAKALSTGGTSHGSPLKVLDNYFIKDFYKEHLRAYYSGRPIYFPVSSGKSKAFFAYTYYHRIDINTIKYIKACSEKLTNALENKGDKAENKNLIELYSFAERIESIIEQGLRIDFDEGIMYNYNKLRGLLISSDRQF
ncbi:MAG: hypothetical protein GX264_07915 [Clostridiales bacterium]|nr:hypothetical protein [Clostridiales bacterium]